MATRGKMETRQRFHSQIINRQQKIAQKVKSIDESHFGKEDDTYNKQGSFKALGGGTNIMKKF